MSLNDDTRRSVQIIEEAIQNLRAVLDEQLSQLEASFKAGSNDIHEKVAERKRFAENLELDRKLASIWEEVRPYPMWRDRDDWSELRMAEIEDPQKEEREKEQDVSFLLNGHRYTFTYHDDGGTMGFSGEPYHHTRLSLRDSTNKVFIEIKLSVEYDEVGSWRKPIDVRAFIPGDWIQDFLECYERLQVNRKERDIRQRYDFEKVTELKNRFGIE